MNELLLPIEAGAGDFAAKLRKEKYSFMHAHPRKIRGEDAEIILCRTFERVPVRLLQSMGVKRGFYWVEIGTKHTPRAWPWRRLRRDED